MIALPYSVTVQSPLESSSPDRLMLQPMRDAEGPAGLKQTSQTHSWPQLHTTTTQPPSTKLLLNYRASIEPIPV
jgi:hypothetical protein